jgi:pilus assembly protein TadC
MTLLVAMLLLAAAHVTAAAYAQQRIPRHTAADRVLLTRALLLVVGTAVGVLAASYFSAPLPALLAFLIGFGTVHVPAALILFIKRERGEARS